MNSTGNRKFLLLSIFLVPFLVTNLISYFVFGHVPHVQDSIAQLFQARIFASGKLYETSHPLKEFFDYTHMINNGRWYSQYPPGHPFFLMFGVLFGMPWIINPLLGALSVLVIYFLGREVYDERTGTWAAIFVILSPFFIFMSAEFMSHASAMFAFACFALFFFKVIRLRKWHYAVLAGSAIGLCITIRPYTALGLAIPFMFYSILLLIKKPEAHLKPFVILTACTMPFILGFLYYNYLTNGDPWTLGYTILYGPSHGIGLGKAAWGRPHTLGQGLADFWDSAKALNYHLSGWPLVSFVPIVLLFFRRRLSVPDYLFFFTFLSLGLVHVFYWFHDLCFGPRLVYEALPFLVLISVQGIFSIPDFIRNGLGFKRVGAKRIENLVKLLIVILFAGDVFITIPGLIKGKSYDYWSDRRYANSYWGVDPYLGKMAAKRKITNSLVFVAFDYPVFPFDSLLWFGSGFLHNVPDLKSDVIYARHLGPRDTLLMNFYPERRYYLYQGWLRSGSLVEINRSSFQ